MSASFVIPTAGVCAAVECNPMNVFYEEEGGFRVGSVLADNVTSLQVEAPHGKRAKIKATSVVLRFERIGLAEFMATAQQLAEAIDIDFLWQCCGADEFSFEQLAREYFGRPASPQESAALLLRLHGAPMYFYKRGKGHYKAAPEEALRAALAGMERKRAQAAKQQEYIAQLTQLRLPPEFAPIVNELLYKPDRAGIEWKALDAACTQLKLTPARLFEACGALESTQAYHLNRFLFEHFPAGAGFPVLPEVSAPADLPDAGVAAFSIDDAATTEIDDAFSVSPLDGGALRIGIHIAAPALGVLPGSAVDRQALQRLSTVYLPGAKITMLPPSAIERFSLRAGMACPSLSLYLDVADDFTIRSVASRVDRVRVAANLRHDQLERVFNDESVAHGSTDFEFGAELLALWRLAAKLEALRGKTDPSREPRTDYNFVVQDERVIITERRRGSPIDKVVSELMIYVNTEWGRHLAQAGVAAIYRSQAGGKVRMSTVASSHEGLGVEQYAWASSPLRRYVDLVNQRQMIAMLQGVPAPFVKQDPALLALMHDFELAYDAYAEFQRHMERYWCLRWLLQEGVVRTGAAVIRDNLVRIDALPLVVRVPSLPELPSDTRVEVEISHVDLIDLTLHCEYRQKLAA